MTTYRIEVTREDLGVARGTIRFYVDGAERFSTPCWEDPQKLIATRTYTGCSTTMMVSKNRKGVYLPDDQTGRTGIFVHEGTGPSRSDGCIVAAASRIEEIWNSVPRDARNVTVVVT